MLLNIQSQLLFCLLFQDIDQSCYPSVAFLKSVSIDKPINIQNGVVLEEDTV